MVWLCDPRFSWSGIGLWDDRQAGPCMGPVHGMVHGILGLSYLFGVPESVTSLWGGCYMKWIFGILSVCMY